MSLRAGFRRSREGVRSHGITVIPPADTPDMSTQLHLVDTKAVPSSRPASRAPVAKASKASKARKNAKSPENSRTAKSRRAGHWHTEWRLDDRTRQVGQLGVAAAREALAQARRPAEQLSRAS